MHALKEAVEEQGGHTILKRAISGKKVWRREGFDAVTTANELYVLCASARSFFFVGKKNQSRQTRRIRVG